MITLQLSAVEVALKEAKFTQSKEKVKAFKKYLKNKGDFVANNEKDLLLNLEDDTILANQFFTKYYSKEVEAEVENMVNRYLADAYIKKIQDETVLDDKIVESYYLDNIEKFKVKPVADILILQFENLDDATKFYNTTKKDSNSLKIIRNAENKIKKKIDYKHPINRMYPAYRDSLRDYKQSDYFTPPQYIRGSFVVLYIRSVVDEDRYYPIKDVKKYILKTLHKEVYTKERKKILDNYRDKK
jgi:hypothetical protein